MKNLLVLFTLAILVMSCEKAQVRSLEKELDGSFGVYHYLNANGEMIYGNALVVSKNNHMELSVDGLVTVSGYFHAISKDEIMWNDRRIRVTQQGKEFNFTYLDDKSWVLMKKFN